MTSAMLLWWASLAARCRTWRIGVPPLTTTLDTFERATGQADWSMLYTLMGSEIRQANIQAEFVAVTVQINTARGAIVALRRGTVGGAQTNADGATLAIVAYALDRQTMGGIVTTKL
jgi:hypothetical protein